MNPYEMVASMGHIICWALQYGPDVEVLRPKELREQLREAVRNPAKKYQSFIICP